MNGSARRFTWQLVGFAVVAVVAWGLGRELVRSWPAVHAYPWRVNWPLLAASVVCAQVGYVLLTRAWRSVLRGIEVRLPLTRAYWIFIISNLGRYLPGKFWQIGAAAWMGGRLGLSARDVAASIVVYQLYLLPAGAALALSWGDPPAPFDHAPYRIITWLLVAGAAATAVWPHRVLSLVRPLTRRLGVDPERWRIDISRRIGIAIQCAMGWSCLALAFGLFCATVTPLGSGALLHLGRAFILSYLIGYLTLIAPGGLGVREGALALVLSPVLGAGPATALALLSRIWITGTEIVALVPALIWFRRDRASRSGPSPA